MQTSDLKLILESIQTLGADGKTAFIWYLVLSYAVYPAICATAVLVGIRLARAAIVEFMEVSHKHEVDWMPK